MAIDTCCFFCHAYSCNLYFLFSWRPQNFSVEIRNSSLLASPRLHPCRTNTFECCIKQHECHLLFTAALSPACTVLPVTSSAVLLLRAFALPWRLSASLGRAPRRWIMETGLPGRTQLAGPGPAGQGARAPLGHWDGNGVKLSRELGCCYASALGRALFIALLPWLGWVNFAVCAWPCCLSDLVRERNYLGRWGGDRIWFLGLISGQKQISCEDSGGNSLANWRVWSRIEWNNWDSPKGYVLAIELFHLEPPPVHHQAFPRRNPASGQISNVYELLGALNQSRSFLLLLEMVWSTQLFQV